MTSIHVDEESALIVVDIQNDFTPGGALPVKGGDEVIGPMNAYIRLFKKKGRPIIFTRDWHPPNHVSFKDRGGPWPPHCVQGTKGAEFHPALKLPDDAVIISKGFDPEKEAYSGFAGTNLSEVLKAMRIRKLFIGGLATDYCVKNTVIDALNEGFFVYFLSDASKGVDVSVGDSEKAMEEMVLSGARIVKMSDVAGFI